LKDLAHIFISYRRDDFGFASKLAADLKNIGVKVWLDNLGGLEAGMQWPREIENAIDACSAFIAILTPDYRQSDYCRLEIKRARDVARPILPVMLRALSPNDLPIEIQDVQWVDFTGWADPVEYDRRLTALYARLVQADSRSALQRPNEETRYLNSLIAELESALGVMEYAALSGEAEVRQAAPVEDEWGFEFLAQDAHDKNPPVPLRDVAEAVERFPHFVLLGEPGAGKTTTLRRLAYEMAQRRIAHETPAPLPLLLYLPQWRDDSSALEFIRAKFPLGYDPLPLLRTGDIRLYLDGLNEMGAEGGHKASQLRAWLESAEAPKSAIITCRQEDYGQRLNLNLTKVQIKPLSPDQVRVFAARYLHDRTDQFFTQQEGGEKLPPHLLSNPYFLVALIQLFKNDSASRLPRNSGALFHKLAQSLWQRERRRGTHDLPFNSAIEAFGTLAHRLVMENLPLAMPTAFALETLGDPAWLTMGANANYLTLADGQVAFYHQLLQEYFAAAYCLRHPDKRPPVREAPWQTMTYYYGERTYTAWDRFYIIMAGIADNADELVTQMDERLAAYVIGSGAKVSPEVRKRLQDYWLMIWENPGMVGMLRHEQVTMLACVLEAEQALPSLIESLYDDFSFRGRRTPQQAALQALAQIDSPEARRILEQWGRATELAQLVALHQAQPADKEELARIGALAVPVLLTAHRKYSDWMYDDVREVFDMMPDTAVEGLLKLNNPGRIGETYLVTHPNITISQLFARLRSGKYYEGTRALLEAMKDAAVPAILNYLASVDDTDITEANIKVLTSMGVPAATEALKQWKQQ